MTQEETPKTSAPTEGQAPESAAATETQPGAPGEGQAAKDNLPPVAVAIEEAGTLKKKITVTVPRARIDAKFGEMFGELSTTALVPGFRIGHAPRKLIEKRFGKDVSQDVRNAVIGESLSEGLEKSTLKVLGEPQIDLEKIELPEAGDLAYSFEVEVAPEFDLPELSGIPVRRPKLQYSEGDADAYVEQLRRSRARFEISQSPAAEGDVVTAGAKITGEGIESLDRPGLTLRVAPGQIEGLPLVDLGKALAGKKAGETASLKVTVPEAHPNEAWRGKELQVEIVLSEIRTPVLPEFNEAFCAELGFASPEQLRQYVGQRLQMQVREKTQQALRDQIVAYLLEKTSFEVPEGVAARHAHSVLSRRYVDLLSSGVPREKIDENLAQLQAQAAEQARTSLKVTFILGKVAEREKIEITAGEVNARIAQMAARYNRRPERFRQELETEGTLGDLESTILEEKAIDALLTTAQVTDEPEEAAPAAAAEEKKEEKA
jgi:trigger factor